MTNTLSKLTLLSGSILGITLLASSPNVQADARAGMATGYPPYQFLYQGELTGFDVAVARAI